MFAWDCHDDVVAGWIVAIRAKALRVNLLSRRPYHAPLPIQQVAVYWNPQISNLDVDVKGQLHETTKLSFAIILSEIAHILESRLKAITKTFYRI